MDFYLDFEATRFSNRIISIGCSAGDGATFSTLVKPVKKDDKVDKFITKLTGITNEMLADAPSADEAFANLFDFMVEHGDSKQPTYYVYGNCDIDFLKATVKYMTNTKACMCVHAIMGGLVDYAPTVRKFFSANADLSLRKVYMLVKCYDEMIQKHDALEDAIMLQTVVENLYDKCKPEDKEILMAMPTQKKPKIAGSGARVPQYFLDWNAGTKADAKTDGTAEDWTIRAEDRDGAYTYFKAMEMAVMWTIKFQAKNLSPKNQTHIDRVKKAIERNSQQKEHRAYNCFWTLKNN